jgi:cyclic 2,3-diphosphoglycerate synthetase
MRRAIVLVDGEHYPDAVADAVARLRGDGVDVVCAALVGGTEKLRGGTPDYGVPLVTGESPVAALRAAAGAYPAGAVIDLADEPVLVFEERMKIVGAAAGMHLRYLGADTVVAPPTYERVDVPSLAIIGTGKRIGKTAISAHLARFADRQLGSNGDIVVIAMGRGGPAVPVVVDRAGGPITVERLLELSRSGLHAASDYLEDAALTGLTTIGCRRVGGGLLGVPVDSNIPEGARLAEQLEPALAIFEGSGSCIPPVAADRTILVASTARERDLLGDLGSFRIERADLLLVVGDDAAHAARMCNEALAHRPELDVVPVKLVPTAAGEVAGAHVAAFTTAPKHVLPIVEAELSRAGARVELVSGNLARRDDLAADLDVALSAGVDRFVVEIKAAAIDAVAEAADRAGVEITFLDNLPVAHDGPDVLDSSLAGLVDACLAR